MGEADLRAFIEITAANELDVLVRQPELLDKHGRSLFDLFGRCRTLPGCGPVLRPSGRG